MSRERHAAATNQPSAPPPDICAIPVPPPCLAGGAMAIQDLLVLLGKCKADPESYYEDFQQRLRHYKALLVRA